MIPNEWMLANRIRFAAVQTAVGGAIVLGITAITQGISALSDGLWFLIAIMPIAFLLNAWVWYPLAKKKATAQRG